MHFRTQKRPIPPNTKKKTRIVYQQQVAQVSIGLYYVIGNTPKQISSEIKYYGNNMSKQLAKNKN